MTHATPETNDTSLSTECLTFLRILREETRRKFDDGAVHGGLDTYLQRVISRPESKHFPSILSVIAALPQNGYASLTEDERKKWAAHVIKILMPQTPQPTPSLSKVKESRINQSGKKNGLRKNDKRKRESERVGVHTVGDLLWYFPNRHADFTNVKPIASLMVGESATVVGKITKSQLAYVGRRRKNTEATIQDESGSIRALWFNQPYLVKSLPEGMRIGLAGKVGSYRGRPQFESPEWEQLEDNTSTHVARFVPIYPLTRGLPGRTVRRLTRTAVNNHLGAVIESLPSDIREELGYPNEQDAIHQLHFPDSLKQRDAARERLAFQELLAIQIAVLRRKRAERERADALPISMGGDFLQQFVDALPFQLTNAQMRSITELRTDMSRQEPMARLLQGDVGSGKTIVAAIGMLAAVAAGHQAVIMAPTEILAEQHYATFNRIFGGDSAGSVFHNYTVAPALGRPIRMALLTGSIKSKAKRDILRSVKQGELDIVVGTHALIESSVSFQSLAMAVVDEQHRFGVMQRDALRNKGAGGGSPHLLVMTATPIPRTLALTIYGDLEISQLDELPPGRMDIKTTYAGPDQREEIYRKVREEINSGRQVFIICPLVEESDVLEAKSATAEFDRLRTNVFPDLLEKMRLLHGRMSVSEKDEAMESFRNGTTLILVSTSVIEVGVDVPNASIMIIEGADRFGLAQLHQFRGRVGRSEQQSYCYLLSESNSQLVHDRLTLLEKTTDGFLLAESDLRMRGPGEYFGTRQSGLPDLRVAKLTDQALLIQARNFAERILEQDPNLRSPNLQPLAHAAGQITVDGAEAVH